jgi:hypothetical protein
MEATLIKRLDNGWPVYSLRRADGKMIATTRFPFDEPALMIAKNAGIELQKLSHENCDEIFGVVNVEKLAEEEFPYDFDCPLFETLGLTEKSHKSILIGMLQGTLIKGFNKAMELNKDKQFTIEDMKRAFIAGSNFTSPDEVVLNETFGQSMNRLIKSLQQPTEIKVEIEMELHPTNHASGLELTGNKLMDVAILENYQPKLDSDGCLILKKKEV